MNNIHPEYRHYFLANHSGRRLVFLNIPKNASTTIRNVLKMTKVQNIFLAWPNDYIFAVLRDPFMRFVSGYHEAISRAYKTTKLQSFWEHRNTPEGIELCLQDLREDIFDIHLTPQSFWLYDESDKPYDIDRYINFANLDQSMIAMLKDFDIQWHYQRHQVTPQKTHATLVARALPFREAIELFYKDDVQLWKTICKSDE